MPDNDAKLKIWTVTFQIVGTGSIEVHAEDEDSAKEKAMKSATFEDVEDWNIRQGSMNATGEDE